MPLKILRSFSVATDVRHGLLGKLNTPQPWWRKQKYPRTPVASLTVISKSTRPTPSDTRIPQLNHSGQATHGHHHSSGAIISAHGNSIGDSMGARDVPIYIDEQPVSKDTLYKSSRLSNSPDQGIAQSLLTGITPTKATMSNGIDEIVDPEANTDIPANEEEVKEALSRPPPVNSDYLPLPWKGRLGYVSCPCGQAFTLTKLTTSRARRVYVHTFGIQTRRCLALGHAGSRPY
jgi:hypothetical protein